MPLVVCTASSCFAVGSAELGPRDHGDIGACAMATSAGRQWGSGASRRDAATEPRGAATRSFQTGANGDLGEGDHREAPREGEVAEENRGGHQTVEETVEGVQRTQEDPWQSQQEDPWWQGSWQQEQGWWSGGWSSGWGERGWWNDRGKDFADPPSWAGWPNYRLWKRSIQRWDAATDVQVHRRAERIFKTMDWELQARFEHLEDDVVTGPDYLSHIVRILDTLSGENTLVDKRRAVRRALFEGQRKDGESISQFTLRREQEFAMAEKYMSFPGDLKALMMEEQAGLGKQGTLNLRTLTSGSTQYEDVVRALKVMDLDEEGLTATGRGKSSFVAQTSAPEMDLEDASVDFEDQSIKSEEVRDILAEIDELDLQEDEATEVLASMEREKRSWKENKKLKLARKKDRRHFSGKPGGSGERRQTGISVDQLKKVSRCSNCGEKGHWAEDCSKPYRSKKERLAQEAGARKGKDKPDGRGGFRPAAFVFLGSDETREGGQGGSTFVAVNFAGMAIPEYVSKVLDEYRKRGCENGEIPYSFLAIPPGHAIIDPGAGQDLIGLSSYRKLVKELRKGGLQPVKLQEKPSPASGVGGRATTLFTSLIPFTLGGAPGIVKVTVVKEDIPHLLSIGLLESAGSIINTRTNAIHYENFGSEDTMLRMSSGHRTVCVASWPGGDFPVPEEVQEKYNLGPGDFNLDHSPAESYMGGGRQDPMEGRDHWKSVDNTPLLLRIHQLPRGQSFTPSSNDPEGWSVDELSDVRVSLMMSSDGSILASWDDWRSDGVQRHEHEWRGVSVFFRRSTDGASETCPHTTLGAEKVLVVHAETKEDQTSKTSPAYPAFATGNRVNERTSTRAMAGDRAEERHGEGRGCDQGWQEGGAEGTQEQGGRGSEEGRLPSPTVPRGSRSEPVWEVGALPEMSIQDLVRASLPQAADQEGEGLQHGVCQDGGGAEAIQEGEGGEGGRRGVLVGGCLTADPGGEQHAAASRHDAPDEPGVYTSGTRAAGDHGDDAAVTGESDSDDAGGSAGPVRDDSGPGTARSQASEGRGLGSSGGGGPGEASLTATEPEEEVENEEQYEGSSDPPEGSPATEEKSERGEEGDEGIQVSVPIRHALRYRGGAGPMRTIKLLEYDEEDDERPRMACVLEDLKTRLEEEDLTDDYEAGIPKGARKAAIRMLSAGPRQECEDRGPGETAESEEKSGEEEKSEELGSYPAVTGQSPEARRYKVMELFSPPRITKECEKKGIQTTSIPAFDLTEGWDFFNAGHRKEFWRVLEEEQPDLVVMTPECRGFSQMMNVNWERMNAEDVERLRTACMAMLQFCVRVADYQLSHGRRFLLEQPAGASSWDTHAVKWLRSQEGVHLLSFDQCRFGLNPSGRGLSRKRTSFLGNHYGIYDEFFGMDCSGDHEHVQLEGGLTHKARIWPPPLVEAVVRGIRKEERFLRRQGELGGLIVEEDSDDEEEDDRVFAMEGEESGEEGEEEEEEEDPETMEDAERKKEDQAMEGRLSQEQKAMINRLHHNMGHLPVDRMIVMLKAARAKESVLKYVKEEYKCEVCMRQRREISRRPAAFPRTFEFNRVIGVDTFFVKWRGKSIPFLNVVDHGSNWQTVVMTRPVGGDSGTPTGGNPTSAETWHHFMRCWVRTFGAPEVVICDGGMEFRDRFERGLEQLGCLQVTTDQESPWQNGRVERHGQWLKERLQLESQEAAAVVTNLNDLEELAYELTACKNLWFNRGGYSPAQLAFGRNPRLPADLLSDADRDSPGWSDILCDPTEADSAAKEFKRSHEIRERAKALAMKTMSKEKIAQAGRPPLHRYRTWTAGQWVLVWRLSKNGTSRHRWVGPGLVILQNGHTVYVAMRSRLWKCNSDQLRPATRTEELGMQVLQSDQYKQLLDQMQKQKYGAVDVAREGSPGEEAWRSLRRQDEEAPVISTSHQPLGDVGQSLPTPLEHPLNPVIVGPMRVRGPRQGQDGADAAGSDAVTPAGRRGSRETVSEPASEPRENPIGGEAVPKRRRTLETVSEEGMDPLATSSTANRPGVVRGGATLGEEEATRSTSTTEAGVRGRVRAIEDEIQRQEEERATEVGRRRRSRSPVPEILRRQRAELGLDAEENVSFSWQGGSGEEVMYVEGTSDQRQVFKEESRVKTAMGDQVEDSLGCLINISTQAGNWAVEAPRNGEITWKQMTAEEAQQFEKSDLDEWTSLEKEFKAVKVWKGQAAEELRQKYRDRIMTARVVRRKKPMPGLHQFKAKSRFCVHGHKDPDGGTFRTFAPTPTAESLHLVCQIIVNLDMKLLFADVKAAFAQADRLVRPRGRLFVEPCDGTPLERGDLIELVAPVYGLDDAPLRWFETIGQHLRRLGFIRSLLDPCVFTKYDEKGELEAVVLVEVDDFLIACRTEEIQKWIQEKLCSRFKFGKWERDEADYIGRRIQKVRTTDGPEIRFSQEKYVVEKIHPIELSRGRRGKKEDPLTEEEFKSFRSMLYRISWVAHQTRPEVSGTVSILASKMHRATVQEAVLLNKAVGHLRSTSKQALRIRGFESSSMTFIGVSDAGGVDGDVGGNGPDGMVEDPVQGAWMVLTSSSLPTHDRRIPVSVISWRSSKLKRRVTSTMASETLALSQCLGEVEWLQVMFRDLMYKDVDTQNYHKSITPFLAVLPEKCKLNVRQTQCTVTDAKSLYDAL